MSAISRLLLWIFILTLTGGSVYGAYRWWVERRDRPPELNTAVIDRGEITQTVTATGDLQPVVSVEVSSQISGIISDVIVDFNSPVRAGQVLATIDPSTYEANVNQAESELASAETNLAHQRLNLERIESLFARELVSRSELDQALVTLRQAESAVNTRRHSLERAKVDLARCTIYAPIDGIVLSRQAEMGKTVAASLNAPTLFVIVNDLNRMQIIAAVSEADIGVVAMDQPVQFTVDAFPARRFRGQISQIRNSPVIRENVVNYEVVIAVDNSDLRLKPGMTANVSIVVASRTDTLRAPNSALRVRLPDSLRPSDPPRPLASTNPGGLRAEGRVPGSGAREGVRIRSEGASEGSRQMRPGGGGSGRRGAPEETGAQTRIVYIKPAGGGPLQAVTVRTGITDGAFTEIIEGVNDGDEVVTGLALMAAGGRAGSSNPFSPSPMGRRF